MVHYFVGFVRYIFFIKIFNKEMKYKEILILGVCLSFVMPLAKKIIYFLGIVL